MLAYLPPNVQKVIQIAAGAEHARYGAMTGVHVVGSSDGPCRVEATDGRRAVVIQCDYEDLQHDALANIPEWDGEVVIDKADWNLAFKNLPTLRQVHHPAHTWLGIGAEGDQVILASGPQTVRTTKPVEGRFPNVLNVFDPAEVITFVVDPKLLIGLLEVMMCVHPNCVTFHAPLKKDGRIGLLAKGHPDHNTGGQIADGVIVPLIARDDK